MGLKGGALVVLVVAGIAGLTAAVSVYVRPDSVATISRKWEASTHADAQSEAFTHWDDTRSGRIPPGCAKCHSTLGFHDFLGVDGTTERRVDDPARIGTVIYCAACHNPSADGMTRVAFPSGATIGDLRGEAVCMQCHQGLRASGDVEEAIGGRAEDRIAPDLTFINVHYAIAAATWLGTEVQGGYEYPDRSYVGRFEHVPDLDACDECHDPHSQTVDAETCSPCHVEVSGPTDLSGIRTSEPDYDGDGDAEEGLSGEIETVRSEVYAAMQAYAAKVIGTPLAYVDRFPYHVEDTNENGQADPDEISSDNRYSSWTPRLLRVAYNHHFSVQDPGDYAHNGRYVLQLLCDGLRDLGEADVTSAECLVRPSAD